MESRKREVDEEEQAFLPQPGPRSAEHDDVDDAPAAARGWTWYLRLLLDIAMAATIGYLLVFKPLIVGRETIRRTPVPRFPHKIYTFHDNPRYVRGDMWFNESLTLHTLHNWVELSSASRGYIVLDDSTGYDLPAPYSVPLDRHTDGPGYMMTVFHQLHCLSYLAEHYQQGYAGVALTEEVAHHTAHCFNYLRQGLMCTADTTLEGKTEAGPGEGSEHECVDYDALLAWANDHAGMNWRNGLMPEDSTL